MVDEFQDTNRLQCELIDLVAHPDLTEVFTVGDEFQSIYGFRHADLEVFRERRAQASTLLALTRNYRSRPQVLEAVNHLFGNAFGDDYSPWRHPRSSRMPCSGIPSSCSLPTRRASPVRRSTGARARPGASQAACASSSTPARPNPARSSCCSPRARMRSSTRRLSGARACRRIARPGGATSASSRSSTCSGYLRLLHNRYDDVALATVLASPFVGVSNDSLVLLRRNAQRRPLFTALERALPEQLDPGGRAAPARVPPALRAPGSRFDADRARGALREGRQRARLRPCRSGAMGRDAPIREPPKLGRLARDYESVRGADIEGFVRFVRDQDALGAKELEAVAEEEGEAPSGS